MKRKAFKWGFVGIGQGGCRIADSFYRLGYEDCVFINTAEVDLALIECPEDQKILIGDTGDGAGKDPTVAERALSHSLDAVKDALGFVGECEQIFVCAGAGGGTGTGACLPVFHLIKELMPDTPVGIIASMPGEPELVSAATARNAQDLLSKCCDLVDSKSVHPLIVIDNQEIRRRVKPRSLRTLWVDGNNRFALLMHKLNTLSATPTMLVSLDKADLKTLMFSSGTLSIGSHEITHPEDEKLIASHLNRSFTNGILSRSDSPVEESDCACVLTVPPSVLDGEVSFFDRFSSVVDKYLTRMPNTYVHRGIYEDEHSASIYSYVLSVGTLPPRDAVLSRFK